MNTVIRVDISVVEHIKNGLKDQIDMYDFASAGASKFLDIYELAKGQNVWEDEEEVEDNIEKFEDEDNIGDDPESEGVTPLTQLADRINKHYELFLQQAAEEIYNHFVS
jgi:hypothetical protein